MCGGDPGTPMNLLAGLASQVAHGISEPAMQQPVRPIGKMQPDIVVFGY